MSSFRSTRQVCARVRQVCERLAGPHARKRHGMRRDRPAPEQKSRQRIGFSSVGRIDRAAGSGEPQVRAPIPMPAIAPAPKNPILWRDFCMASRANAPRAAFSGPVGAFPGRAGSGPIRAAGGGHRRAAQRAVGPNIKQCMLCIKPRSAMRGCAEGRKALRLMRKVPLYRRFTSKKWSITKPRHTDTLSGKYLPLIRYLSPLNSKYE